MHRFDFFFFFFFCLAFARCISMCMRDRIDGMVVPLISFQLILAFYGLKIVCPCVLFLVIGLLIFFNYFHGNEGLQFYLAIVAVFFY